MIIYNLNDFFIIIVSFLKYKKLIYKKIIRKFLINLHNILFHFYVIKINCIHVKIVDLLQCKGRSNFPLQLHMLYLFSIQKCKYNLHIS